LFLPIKVILLIGQSNLPRYLPDFFLGFEKQTLIFILCIASVSFYALHVIFEMLIEYLENKSVISILAKVWPDSKLSGVSKNLFKKTYRRTTNSLAELVFFITVVTLLSFINIGLLAVISIYAALATAFFSVYHLKNTQQLSDNDGNDGAQLKVMFDIGFLLTFVYIVYDLISQAEPAIFTAFISFLLLRQSSGGLKRTVTSYRALNNQRPKLDVLILGKQDEKLIKKNVIAPFINKEQVINLVVNALSLQIDEIQNKFEVSLCELSGSRDVQAFIVKEQGREAGKSYLLKLYRKKSNHQAEKEKSLLELMPALPALNFIITGTAIDYDWHLYEWMDLEDSINSSDILAFKEEVMALEPTKQLVDEWQHDHRFIWQRMDEHYWQALFQFAEFIEPEVSKQLKIIKQHHKVFGHILGKLPLVLVNQETGKMILRKLKATNTVISLRWEKWSIEPLGAGLSTIEQGRVELENTINKLKENRPDMSSIDINAVKLSAMLYSLESLVNKQAFNEAFELLPKITKLINNSLGVEFK
jgi:hypothetical protein